MKDRKELVKSGYNIAKAIVQAQELLKELNPDFSYDKDVCTDGLPKKDVAKILRAAKAKAAQNNLKEKAEELLEVDALIDELE